MAEDKRRQQLESLTADELRQRARKAGHSGLSRLRKAELVDLLLKQPSQNEAAKKEQLPSEREERAQLKPISPVVGRLLQSAGLVGLVASLIITLALPVAAFWFSGRVSEGLNSAASGLDGAASGLDLGASNLEAAANALDSVALALRSADRSLQSMDPLLTAVGDLMAEQLPESIDATQEALLAAQDSARAMDRVLRGLRLFGLDYDPELPLDQSLAQTAESLDGLPESLRRTETELTRSRREIEQLSGDLEILAEDLETLSGELDASAEEAQQATQSLERAADNLRAWSMRMPLLRWVASIVALIFGLWLLALHLNLWVSGKTVAEEAS